MEGYGYDERALFERLDKGYGRKEIDMRELLEFSLSDPLLVTPYPLLTSAYVNKTFTWMIKYYGSKQVHRPGYMKPQNVFLFPVIPPAIEEIEYSGPSEWRVFYIGSVAELLASNHGYQFDKLRSLNQEDLITVLKVKREMYDLKYHPMSQNYYIGGVVSRVIEGYVADDHSNMDTTTHLIIPKTYIYSPANP